MLSPLLVFLTACPSKPTSSAKFPFAPLQQSGESRQAISGTITLTHSSGGKSISVPGVMLAEWPDKLRLEVQDPVGSVLLLLLVNGDRFWLYRQDGRENLTGPLIALPRGILPPMNADDLLRVFLARPRLEPFLDAAVSNRTAVSREKLRQTLSWDSSFLVENWEFQRADGARDEITYSDFTFRGGQHFPGKVRLRREVPGKSDESILLVWNDWEPSVPKEKKLFLLPPQQQFGRPTKALP